MTFRVSGLDPAMFRHLYGLSDEDLASQGVKRYVANAKPGFPDRIEVRDVEPGDTVLLLNFEHQPAPTPYRASHAIFVREGADTACSRVDAVPEALGTRWLSVRAFDEAGEMVDAALVEGAKLEPLIRRLFANPDISYLHAHYATRGCYAARIDRA